GTIRRPSVPQKPGLPKAPPPSSRRRGPGPTGEGVPPPGAPYPYWALGVSTRPVRLGDRPALHITRVVAGGDAQRAGLKAGDIILDAGGGPARSQEDLLRAISRSGGSLKLTV